MLSIPLSKNIINWYLENVSLSVSDDERNTFLNLKNNVEGWKKGTQIRNTKYVPKNTIEIIRENLSLYLNQISASNYNIIEKKIVNEIDNSLEAQNLLIELILSNCLSQTNNLQIIVQLLGNLKYIPQLLNSLNTFIEEGNLKTTDPNNYDQLCVDNRYNLKYKNSYILLGIIFNKSCEITINKIIDYFIYLEKRILDQNTNKELSEKYLDIYVDFLRLIGSQLKKSSPEKYDDIIAKLNQWKDMKPRFTNRARFSILDYLDEIQDN